MNISQQLMDSRRRTNHKRSASASIENQSLRDTVSASQYQLLKCQDELKHTKDQLKCLIHLVKRAWSGDVEASVHVANIVGIAPPDLHLRGDTNEIVAVPKNAALNHWASLTIGLLNREYAKDERENKRKQLTYFEKREQYLDKQLNGFIQDPEFRESPDAAATLTGKMLKNLKEEQDLREKSSMELQNETKQQRENLSQKQKLFKSRSRPKVKRLEEVVSVTSEDGLSDFCLQADPSLLCQKQIASAKMPNDRVIMKGASSQKEISPTKSISTTSTTKRPPRPMTSKHAETKEPKVQVMRKKQRPYSAKDEIVSTSKSNSELLNNARRRSFDSSSRRDEHKLDRIERELKRTTSELQRKLNIDPNGCLKFR